MVVDLNCSLNNDFHSLYIHFHRLFDLSDNLCCHRDSDGKQIITINNITIIIIITQVAYWLAHIRPYQTATEMGRLYTRNVNT